MQHRRRLTVERHDVEKWVESYEQAWRTAGTAPLADLFSAEAAYRMSPYEEPATGLAEIGELWERERRGHDEEFEMTHEVVAIDGDTAVIRVEVRYGPPQHLEYRDLWIVRLDRDGRCCEFEEWPFWPGQQIDAEGGGA